MGIHAPSKLFGQKAPTEFLGLYIHIPFCRQKCWYCDFYSLEGQKEQQIDAYVSALCAHLTESAVYAGGMGVDTVYFGGGTPSLLGKKRLLQILKVIKKEYHVTPDAEITLEANPDSIGDWKDLKALHKAGFNRISLGMQSSSDSELQRLGRIHTYAQTVAAVEAVRMAGFTNLSLDVMYALPGQTLEDWQKTLEDAIALRPEHISSYGLKVEFGTPFYAIYKNTEKASEIPDDDTQADYYLWMVQYLEEYGYQQYEVSNFAKKGMESRHNLKYWTLQEYAGFGPGAYSDLGGSRYAYAKDLRGYIQGIQNHNLALSESENIPWPMRDVEWIMLRLRMISGIDPLEYEHSFHRKFQCFLPYLERCEASGYAVWENHCWHLTPKGFLVSNQIIGDMIDIMLEHKKRQAEALARGDYRLETI